MTDKEDKVVDLAKIRRDVVARAGEESVSEGGDGGGLSSKFVRQCLFWNELGDGVLYARLHAGRFLYVKASDAWLEWTGHHWEYDQMGRHYAAMESVTKLYEKESASAEAEIGEAEDGDEYRRESLGKLQKALRARCSDLRTRPRRNNALHFSHTCDVSIAIGGEEIDAKPWLLPCENGVINLKTGELEAGRQTDYLLKASPVEWRGIDEPCPVWDQFLLDTMDGDPEMVEFLQRLFGYSLVGDVIHSIFVVMTGKGRNGKSVLMNTINSVIGPLAGTVASEMLLDQSFIKSSSGPSPDIMSLKGIRVAVASETGDNCRVHVPKVKWLTGKDILKGRHPNDKFEVEFTPTHTLFLITNYMPHASGDDFAFWERMYCIPFPVSFVDRIPRDPSERKSDPFLGDKLAKELPGILAWMVRGCLLWQEIGLAPPPKVLDANKNYQANEDFIAEFLDICCIRREGSWLAGGQLHMVFEVWYRAHIGNFPPKIKRFGTLLGRRIPKKKDGVVKYLGLDFSNEGLKLFEKAQRIQAKKDG